MQTRLIILYGHYFAIDVSLCLAGSHLNIHKSYIGHEFSLIKRILWSRISISLITMTPIYVYNYLTCIITKTVIESTIHSININVLPDCTHLDPVNKIKMPNDVCGW